MDMNQGSCCETYYRGKQSSSNVCFQTWAKFRNLYTTEVKTYRQGAVKARAAASYPPICFLETFILQDVTELNLKYVRCLNKLLLSRSGLNVSCAQHGKTDHDRGLFSPEC